MSAIANFEEIVVSAREGGMSDAEIVPAYFDVMEALHPDVGAEELRILRSLSLDEVIHLIQKAELNIN
jgi:hypothetical protein